jgi:hypothetical protein
LEWVLSVRLNSITLCRMFQGKRFFMPSIFYMESGKKAYAIMNLKSKTIFSSDSMIQKKPKKPILSTHGIGNGKYSWQDENLLSLFP